MKEKLLISACLCGKNTKYNGGNNLIDGLDKIKEQFDLILICPEVMGGLPTPRDPSEIKGNEVFSNVGKNVTKEFQSGAEQSLDIALKEHIRVALLKESSPSCGKNLIYDGTFQGVKISGQGRTTQLLRKAGIHVFSEKEVDLLLEFVSKN